MGADDLDEATGEMALSIIGFSVESHHYPTIDASGTAKEAWLALESVYKSRTVARRLVLKRELNNLQKDPSEPLVKYYSRACTLRQDLVNAGHPEAELDFVGALLSGLPKEYNSIIDVLSVQSPETLKESEVMGKLYQVEQRMSSLAVRPAASTSAALTASHSGAPHQSGRQGDRRSRPSGSQEAPGKKSIVCHYCGKAGHKKKDCFKWKKDERAANGNSDQGSGGQRSSVQASASGSRQPVSLAFMAFADVASTSVLSKSDWVVDSGATNNMTFCKSKLADYEAFPEPRAVTLGDGRELLAEGQGTAVLQVIATTGEDIDLSISKVWYVPGLAMNLLSVKKFTQRHAIVKFEDDHCSLDCKGHVITADMRNHLYVLSESIPPSASAAAVANASDDKGDLWHRRFGHLSFSGLEKLVAKDLVTGVDVDVKGFKRADTPLCEPCVMAKHHRDPFPDSTTVITEKLELVHMDVCGPLPVQSLGGKKYVATFLDEATKLSCVVPIARKSDVPAVVKEILLMLENQSNCKVKRVRTDRGSEYVNAALTDFFAEKGILHNTTAPYTPQQNGATERLNRTLFERTRAMLFDAKLPRNL